MAPSFAPDDPYFAETYRAMTEDEIWELIRAFGDGARRAREAGFDAVQLHGAHGYLPSQFLSPFTNRRTDLWGGSLENRLRFHREVCRDIRKKVGEEYPVLLKVGVQDEFPGGLEFAEGSRAAQLLAHWGYDALEISQGLLGERYEGTEFRTRINCLEREAYFRDWCRKITRLVKVPTMMVGGLRTFALMEEVVQNGEADFISLCRPLIKEPGLINAWKKGTLPKATCISCNKCLEALIQGSPLACMHKESRNKRPQAPVQPVAD
jgi:2,4-dienoyl-CoA reductase-like NADH-dependent reductase (Old Yellow Enzyme family)